MDKLNKLISDFLSTKFDEWKPFLNENEQIVFGLFYFKGMTTYQIAMEMHYCERNVQKILAKARKKIYKLLP